MSEVKFGLKMSETHFQRVTVDIYEVCSNGPGHMTKMVAMPIYGERLKNLLLRSQKADDLETWYAASGARVLPSLFK